MKSAKTATPMLVCTLVQEHGRLDVFELHQLDAQPRPADVVHARLHRSRVSSLALIISILVYKNCISLQIVSRVLSLESSSSSFSNSRCLYSRICCSRLPMFALHTYALRYPAPMHDRLHITYAHRSICLCVLTCVCSRVRSYPPTCNILLAFHYIKMFPPRPLR